MQVETVEHKNTKKILNSVHIIFFLPKDEFCRKYLTSKRQSVTHFKTKDTQDSHFIMYAYSNMPNQVQFRLLTQIHLGLLLSSSVPTHNYYLKAAVFYTNS
jgi:hypothetical protein